MILKGETGNAYNAYIQLWMIQNLLAYKAYTYVGHFREKMCWARISASIRLHSVTIVLVGHAKRRWQCIQR